METFPAFFPLRGRRVVIAGDGPPAEGKARLFAGSPATLVRLEGEAALDPAGYADADLIFVASFDEAFREAAGAVARAAGAPLNVVDRPDLSDFHTPAIIDRGQVVAAIGTAGAAPLLASLLRAEVETHVPESAGRIAALLGEAREPLRARFPDLPARRAFLRGVLEGPAARAAAMGDMALARARLRSEIAEGGEAAGRVTVIVRPAEIDLITLRAVRALNIADVVFAGPAADALLASHARRDAEFRALEEADPASLAELADAGRLVVVMTEAAAPDAAAVASERLTPGGASGV